MNLAAYMKTHNLSDVDMGAIIGKDRTIVSRYRRGEIVPPADVINAIQEATDFAVQFNDWFEKDGQAA